MRLRRALAGLSVAALAAPVLAVPAAADDELIYASAFAESDEDGWFGRGSAEVAASDAVARSEGWSLLTTGRTANWHGPAFELTQLDEVGPGGVYDIVAHVRLAEGTEPTDVKVTVNTEDEDGEDWVTVAPEAEVTDEAWVGFAGTFTVDGDLDRLELYVEAADGTASYHLDDVTITMTTAPGDGPDPDVVYATSFEDDVDGWFVGGADIELSLSSAQARTGEQSLLTTGRDGGSFGPALDLLDHLDIQPGTYAIEAHVRLADGEGVAEANIASSRTDDGQDSFPWIGGRGPVDDQSWTGFSGTFEVSPVTTKLEVFLETDGHHDFHLDDVTITLVAATPGEPGPGGEIVADFEDGTTQGFAPRGDHEVEATQDDAFGGEWSLLTTGREQSWNGPTIEVTDEAAGGTTFDVDTWVKLAPGESPAQVTLSVEVQQGDSPQFINVVSAQATDDGWVQLSGSYTFPSFFDQAWVYVESASATASYYLDDFWFRPRDVPPIQDIPPLKDELAPYFPRFGVAIDDRETTGPSAELLLRHFNAITPENHTKPDFVQPEEGVFTFDVLDQLLDLADTNDLEVYGHVLVWHSQTPDWFFEHPDTGDPLTDSAADQQILRERMTAHIQGIADHLEERYDDPDDIPIWAWDVVNEVISDAGGLRDSRWHQVLGPDFIRYAFEDADELLPGDPALFINDYNTEFPAKSQDYYELIDQLVQDGVPIDGVGHQFHLSIDRPIPWIDATLTMFAEGEHTGELLQAVTELDVRTGTSGPDDLNPVLRAGFYWADLFDVLRTHQLETVTVWGLHDARSWLRYTNNPNPDERPLLFDPDLQANPAYWGVVDPSQLEPFQSSARSPQGEVEVDGQLDVEWQLLPMTAIGVGEDVSRFSTRWSDDTVYVLVDVVDDTDDGAADTVELFVGDGGHHTVDRTGEAHGDLTAVVAESDQGYRVEATLPAGAVLEAGAELLFDVRVTDGTSGETTSWSDLTNEQEVSQDGWGALQLTGPIDHVDVPFTEQPPTIDAEIDAVWEQAPTVRTEVLVEGDPDGARADVRLLWHGEALYLLFEVEDLVLDASHTNAWERDSVEIFIDPGNDKAGAYQPDDAQYRIQFDNTPSHTGGSTDVIDRITHAAQPVDGGYVVEAAIELETMEVEPGATLGLELQVNDATNGGRTAVHTWSDPTGLSFENTSMWGVARLVDETDEDPPPPGPPEDRPGPPVVPPGRPVTPPGPPITPPGPPVDRPGPPVWRLATPR